MEVAEHLCEWTSVEKKVETLQRNSALIDPPTFDGIACFPEQVQSKEQQCYYRVIFSF